MNWKLIQSSVNELDSGFGEDEMAFRVEEVVKNIHLLGTFLVRKI